MIMNMPVKRVKVTEMIKEETQKSLVLLPFKSHLRMNILCIMQEFEIKRISVFEERKIRSCISIKSTFCNILARGYSILQCFIVIVYYNLDFRRPALCHSATMHGIESIRTQKATLCCLLRYHALGKF